MTGWAWFNLIYNFLVNFLILCFILIEVKSLTNQDGLVYVGIESLFTKPKLGPFSDGTETPTEPPHTWANCVPISKLQLKTGVGSRLIIT